MMVTDPARRWRTDPGHPEVCNVFTLHGFFSPTRWRRSRVDCRSAAIGCVECKRRFARNLAEYFAPFRERRAQFAADPAYVWDVLADGAQRARVIATSGRYSVGARRGQQTKCQAAAGVRTAL